MMANAEESALSNVSKSASTISVLVMLSRITGLFRTWGQAYAVGATVLASVYSVANQLPNSLYELVVAGMLTTAFLPVYLSVKKKLGQGAANAYVNNLLSIVVVLMGAATIVCFIFASQIVFTQSFTAQQSFDFDLAVYFFRFFVIEVLLYALSTIFSAVLNAERDYLWSSAAPIFNNIVTTASFIIYAALAPTHAALGLLVLALGNPLGVLVQVLVQMPSLRKHGIHLSWRINLKDPALIDTVRLGVPTIATMVASFAFVSFTSNALLSVDATGASINAYARLWYTLPYAIMAVPITTTLFTEFSDLWAQGQQEDPSALIDSSVRQMHFFMIPFMLYLVVFSVPLVSIIGAGKFGADDISKTAWYLAGMALSLPFYATNSLYMKICYAMRRQYLPAVASGVATFIYIVIIGVFTRYFGLTFVAVANTALMVVSSSFITFGIRDIYHSRRTIQLRFMVVMLGVGLAGALVGALIIVGLSAVWPIAGHPVRGVVYCIAGGIPSLVVTYGLALRLRLPEGRLITSLLNRVVGKRLRSKRRADRVARAAAEQIVAPNPEVTGVLPDVTSVLPFDNSVPYQPKHMKKLD